MNLCSVPYFVVGGIHEEIRGCLLNWPQEECLNQIVEVLGHPGNRSRGEVFDAQMGNDLLDLSRRDALEVGFDDCIHLSLLYPGIPPKDLRLERELPELGFPEDRLAILGLEGSVLVTVSMRLPRVGSLVGIGSGLLESLLEHRLVEEPGDESLHAVLLIGKIIFDKREGIHGPVSPLCKSRLDPGPIQFYRSFVTLPGKP